MALKVGSDVKTTGKDAKYGRITKITGSNADWVTSMGEHRTSRLAELEENDKFSGKWYAHQPDIIEVAANAAIFGVTELARKRKFFGEPTMRFLIQDSAYEFLFKKWSRENIENKLFKDNWIPLVGDAADNFVSQDMKDALSKTLVIAVLDGIYKFAKRGSPFNKSTLMYLMQVAVSFYGADVAQRQWRPNKEGGYNMT